MYSRVAAVMHHVSCVLLNIGLYFLVFFIYLGSICSINVKKTYQFKTQCQGDISHAFETAKIIVFDSVVCKTPDAPLQNELLY